MNHKFQLVTNHVPKGDQPEAIKQLTQAILNNKKHNVLLGATGTGKTFSIANVIQNTQKRTLVLAHNKTLAGQLYNELKDLFPHNKVEYFISYFDYFQPEAYLPATDTFIEKSSVVNETIEMMRLSTLTSLKTRSDVIVVASVACIYPTSPPDDFENFKFYLRVGDEFCSLKNVINKLTHLNYERNDVQLTPGTFSVKGDVIEIMLGHTDQYVLQISFFGDEIESIYSVHPLNKTKIENFNHFLITPANEYLLESTRKETAISRIEQELEDRLKYYYKKDQILEATRLKTRINHDLDSLKELGFCAGIENYAMHLELREIGSTPWCLFDYMGDDWLLVIDESHMTIPQIRGMYNTDRSRKETLVEYGFRLPSALDNRPQNFEEFQKKVQQVIYVSATPNQWEIQQADNIVVEQVVRPTGLIDPKIEIRSSLGQVDDLLSELHQQIQKNERTIITVLTIRMAEELTEYLKQQNIKAIYLHNELKTLERDRTINNLRKGLYDVIVGINLLREGLDIPEVSLVCIFDANKPGFFRSESALIQIIGRAARNSNGRIIMYADTISPAMEAAIKETNRRREIQILYNQKHKIIPQTISKPIRNDLEITHAKYGIQGLIKSKTESKPTFDQTIAALEKQIYEYAEKKEYELAAQIRDEIIEMKMVQTNKSQKRKKSL